MGRGQEEGRRRKGGRGGVISPPLLDGQWPTFSNIIRVSENGDEIGAELAENERVSIGACSEGFYGIYTQKLMGKLEIQLNSKAN